MPAPFGFHSTDGGEVSGLVFDCKEEVSSSSISQRPEDAGEGMEAGKTENYCNWAGSPCLFYK